MSTCQDDIEIQLPGIRAARVTCFVYRCSIGRCFSGLCTDVLYTNKQTVLIAALVLAGRPVSNLLVPECGLKLAAYRGEVLAESV